MGNTTDAKTIRLAIATPALSGSAVIEYTASVLQLQGRLQARGIRTYFLYVSNESMIHAARNRLVAAFLAHPDRLTHLLFIDADLTFDPDDIVRMLDADTDLIGAAYSRKKIDWSHVAMLPRYYPTVPAQHYAAHANNYDLVFEPADRTAMLSVDAPQEAAHIGTGLMLARRGVFEDMMAHYPDDWYYQHADRYFRFFDFGIQPGDAQLVSEDYWFCQRWRAMGRKLYGALWVVSRHFGPYGYPCDLPTVCVTDNISI